MKAKNGSEKIESTEYYQNWHDFRKLPIKKMTLNIYQQLCNNAKFYEAKNKNSNKNVCGIIWVFYNGLIWKRQLHIWHGSNVCLGLLRIHVTSLNLIINIWGSYTMVIFNGIFVYSENFWKYRDIHVEELYSMADGDLKLF